MGPLHHKRMLYHGNFEEYNEQQGLGLTNRPTDQHLLGDMGWMDKWKTLAVIL